MPEDGYGWEKLFSERMCRHFTEDYGLETKSQDFTIYMDLWELLMVDEKAPVSNLQKSN